jgi:two-component system sensor histidine kinase RegB
MAGRSANPFIYYFLVIIALGATLMRASFAWLICVVSIVLYTALMAMDLRAHFAHFSSDYKIHLVGMWLNYLIGALVTCYFVSRLTTALKSQQKRMVEIREKNLKNEQLIGLAAVSANTVHNLATPLSTLGMLMDEMSQQKHMDIQSDLAMAREQIQRCQSSIKDMVVSIEKGVASEWKPAQDLYSELCEHYALLNPTRMPLFHWQVERDIALMDSSLLRYALVNLINNALESSSSASDGLNSSLPVPEVSFTADRACLFITIRNQSTEAIDMLESRWGKPSESSKSTGLGIGSFLANSTIENQGGHVTLTTETLAARATIGVTVTISLPLANNS